MTVSDGKAKVEVVHSSPPAHLSFVPFAFALHSGRPVCVSPETAHSNVRFSLGSMTSPSRLLPTEINPLSRSTSATLRSSFIIPTYPSILRELLHNSLDANATSISIYIDITHGEERVRVEDDGMGIRSEDVGKIASRYESSKRVSPSGLGPASSYGFRGEGEMIRVCSRTGLKVSFVVNRGARAGGHYYKGAGFAEDSIKSHQGGSLSANSLCLFFSRRPIS